MISEKWLSVRDVLGVPPRSTVSSHHPKARDELGSDVFVYSALQAAGSQFSCFWYLPLSG